MLALLTLTVQDLEIHGSSRALISCSWRHYFVDIFSKFAHLEWVVTLVLVLPGEGTLTLLLFPEHLEHSAIEHEVKAVIDSLNSDFLAMHSQLIHKRFRFPMNK